MEKISILGLEEMSETCISYEGDISSFTIVEDFYEHEEGVYFDPLLHQYYVEKFAISSDYVNKNRELLVEEYKHSLF